MLAGKACNRRAAQQLLLRGQRVAEIEEAGGHDPDDVGEHLMAFSHAGEYLAHAITFGEDKLTASVPPRNHGSVKAFCNEFGRDMRNYCAAYDFTMTDSKELKMTVPVRTKKAITRE